MRKKTALLFGMIIMAGVTACNRSAEVETKSVLDEGMVKFTESSDAIGENTSAQTDGESISTEELWINDFVGSTLPLKSYNYNISDVLVIDFDVEEYVVEDENEFSVWNSDELFRVKTLDEKYSDGVEVVPVELHTDSIKYKALKLNNGVYVVDVFGGLEIIKDGEGVSISAETSLRLINNRTEISVADVLGTGTPCLCISGYDSGSGYSRRGTLIFDMEHMRFVEYESSDEYFMDAFRECIAEYIADGGELKDGCKFWLSDKYGNYTGFSGEAGDDNSIYQELRVDYSVKEPSESAQENYICSLRAVYKYDSEKNMLCVDHVEKLDE